MIIPAFTPWAPLGSPADLLARFGPPGLALHGFDPSGSNVGADLGVRWFKMSDPPPSTLTWAFRGVVVFTDARGRFVGAVAE